MFFGEKYINFIVYKQKDRTAKKHVVGSCVVLSFFEGVENKKSTDKFISAFRLYPEPGSNRHGSESTGV